MGLRAVPLVTACGLALAGGLAGLRGWIFKVRPPLAFGRVSDGAVALGPWDNATIAPTPYRAHALRGTPLCTRENKKPTKLPLSPHAC